MMFSAFKFRKYGQSGMDVSEIFPTLAQHVDDFALLRSVYGKSNDHVQAHYELATGMIRMGFPSVGSWVTYGLGSENQSLPAFVVIYDARGGPFGGPANWTAGFMPAAYRSEEHTSELQSHSDLVCRLLLEKKKKYIRKTLHT